MIFDLLTIFPQLFRSPLEGTLIGKAAERGIIKVNLIDIRDYADPPHRAVDDYPYGGGGGMVMKPEPIIRAIKALWEDDPKAWVILLTPQGMPFSQRSARRLATLSHLALVCGRYEGVDERVRAYVDQELSIGDYVLMGGEVPALVVIEGVTRLLPGVLGWEEAVEEDSFSQGLLEHPHYTRPREFEGRRVPPVLLSGDHQAIERWRRREALRRTWLRRPDLLKGVRLEGWEEEFLASLEDGLLHRS